MKINVEFMGNSDKDTFMDFEVPPVVGDFIIHDYCVYKVIERTHNFQGESFVSIAVVKY